jgi:WD40 repeat protein
LVDTGEILSRRRWVAASGGGGLVKVWETATGRVVAEPEGLRGIVFGLSFSPNGEIIAGADSLGMIRFGEVGSWKESLTWRGHDRMIHRIAFSPDGQKLASCSLDQTIKVWNPRNGELLNTLRGHSQRVTSVSFLPNGSQLVSSSLDGTIKLWSLPVAPERMILKGHKALWSVQLEFSPDGRWLGLTTNVPGTSPLVYHTAILDAATRQPITTVAGHPFKFAPNGMLATKVEDASLVVWEIQPTGAVEHVKLTVPPQRAYGYCPHCVSGVLCL